MQDLRFDKLSFTLLILSAALVVVGYGFFTKYNGFNQVLVDHLASVLRVVNPAESNNKAFESSDTLYLSEERSILFLYVIAILTSAIAFLRLTLKQYKHKNVMGFAGLTALSLTLIMGTVYMVVNSGILLDI